MFVVAIHDASIRFVVLALFFVLGFRLAGKKRDLLAVRRPLEALNRVFRFGQPFRLSAPPVAIVAG